MHSLRKIIEKPQFENFVLTAIFFNSITLGLETSPEIMASYGKTLHFLDRLFMMLFTLEIIFKIIIYRNRFFKDPWNIFDFVLVAISISDLILLIMTRVQGGNDIG